MASFQKLLSKLSRLNNGTTSSLSLASFFIVQFSPCRNGIQNFLGDTFGGTVYPEDISCGDTQYSRILCTGIQKTGDAKYSMIPVTEETCTKAGKGVVPADTKV